MEQQRHIWFLLNELRSLGNKDLLIHNITQKQDKIAGNGIIFLQTHR
jgi:hypothetical protein